MIKSDTDLKSLHENLESIKAQHAAAAGTAPQNGQQLQALEEQIKKARDLLSTRLEEKREKATAGSSGCNIWDVVAASKTREKNEKA
ncbi:MAG: hypothetical protein Q9183_002590, partial [Haloplaca sp. 2 TL-2023]